MVEKELKPCPLCGRKPTIEHWSSGGLMYMVKCGGMYCSVPNCGYPSGRNLNEVKAEWNLQAETLEKMQLITNKPAI